MDSKDRINSAGVNMVLSLGGRVHNERLFENKSIKDQSFKR